MRSVASNQTKAWYRRFTSIESLHIRLFPRSGRLYSQESTFLHSVLRLLVTANVVPSSPIFVTLMM
jgi:hypothetical protein